MSKRVLPFAFPWADPSRVGTSMVAPGKPWDGGSWVETPSILAFAPDDEAAAQYVNFLHRQHDETGIALSADDVARDFSAASAKVTLAASTSIFDVVWESAGNQWVMVGAVSGNKRVYTANRTTNPIVDLGLTFGAPASGLAGCAAPYSLLDANSCAPNGTGSRLLAATATDSGTGLIQPWRIDLATGATNLVTVTSTPTGSGNFSGTKCMIIGGKGLTTQTIAFFGPRLDGSFHIVEAPCNFFAPSTLTTSYAASTVRPVSRFKPLRAPVDPYVGDTDCIFELAEFNTGNLHKVFCRRFGSGPASWTKYDEPFAVLMDTAGGTQSRLIGALFDQRNQSIYVAIHRYAGASPGIYFGLFDAQTGTTIDTGVITQFHLNSLRPYNRGILSINAAADVFPLTFDYYNDAWVMLMGGTGTSVMPVWSFDYGQTWNGDASAAVAGTNSFDPTPGGPGAIFSQGPQFYAGDRGFLYTPNMVGGIGSGAIFGAMSPLGGTALGPMT